MKPKGVTWGPHGAERVKIVPTDPDGVFVIGRGLHAHASREISVVVHNNEDGAAIDAGSAEALAKYIQPHAEIVGAYVVGSSGGSMEFPGGYSGPVGLPPGDVVREFVPYVPEV